ncbi:MAG: hypothetical protein K9H64_05425 [Bacteroidales bacterium]|nr:hypothetical protein [Bacteroidales bacterium]MCF8455741.1 hypothetical protein [Bacteroidales bacterium]
MNTIRVSLRNNTDAQLLMRLLRTMNIVENVQGEQEEILRVENQYNKLTKVLDKFASPSLFSKISNPVKWQKEIRDEWM